MAKQKISGEGDYEATRRYRKRTEEYLENNDVEKAAPRGSGHESRRGGRQAPGERRRSGDSQACHSARRDLTHEDLTSLN